MTTDQFAAWNELSETAARDALRWAARAGFAEEVARDVWRPTPTLIEQYGRVWSFLVSSEAERLIDS